jgi:hypothetical protein
VYTWRALSALRIVSLAEPLFRYPLMADGAEINSLIPPQTRHRQYHDGAHDADSHDDQDSIHEGRSVPANPGFIAFSLAKP